MPMTKDTEPTIDHHHALSQLKANLAKEDWPAVDANLRAFADAPGELAVILADVVAVLLAKGQPSNWLDTLLSPESRIWSRLPLLGKLGSLLRTEPIFASFQASLRARAASNDGMPFLENDYLRNIDPDIVPLLLALKYRSTVAVDSVDALFGTAEKIAPAIKFNPKALDRLFERRTDTTLDRALWEQDVRMTRALEHLIGDFHLSVALRLSLFSQSSKDMLRDAFPAGKATVLVFHHGGFATTRHVLLESVLPDTVYLTNHKKISRRLSIEDDTAGSMLEALRHVIKGGMIGISPDGLRGAEGPTINVLGGELAIRAGAALLAFEARAATAWLAVGRRDREFFPIVRTGPQRVKGETFAEFQARFVAFYEACMNEFFTGDPQNLIYTARWLRHLAALPPLKPSTKSTSRGPALTETQGRDRE